MLQNPLQLRLEKLEPWKQITFMASLCERMYPNFVMFCENTEFAEARVYRDILDSIWEQLTVKTAKVNFERQLEKLEEIIPDYAGHIDNQWHASRFANRLRRIAEGDGPTDLQGESPEQWFARKIFDKEGSN